MRLSTVALLLLAAFPLPASEWLSKPVLDPLQPALEARIYVGSHAPHLNIPATAAEWTAYSNALRTRILNEVIFRGQARQWSSAHTRVEWLDTIEASGYRVRKLRYEVVPGFWIPAILYEPKTITGKTVGVLNLSGHEAKGKAETRWQINCINQARRGIVSLKPDWLATGQLRHISHWQMNQIDLTGSSGISIFYMAMSRALDLLAAYPKVDPSRLAVTGLSGGGWQTIVISSLDTRVALANPVAGYSSFVTKSYMPDMDLGDSEQAMSDLATLADYIHLTALLAPRWALITNNAKDNCCFRADYAPAPLLSAVRPVYQLLGVPERLSHFVGYDPDHNYDRANREAFYAALKRAFFAADPNFSTTEIDVTGELRTPEQLNVPLPADNLTMNALAVRLSRNLPRPGGTRAKLASLVRPHAYHAVWTRAGGSGNAELYRIAMNEDWTVPATVLIPAAPATKTVLLLGDEGRAGLSEAAGKALDAGYKVIAIDPINFGENRIGKNNYLWTLALGALGDRMLGVQASQILAIARSAKAGKLRIEAHGHRAALAALVAAALAPKLFETAELEGLRDSLKELIDQNVTVEKQPESFCFGLLEYFDIPQLKQLARLK